VHVCGRAIIDAYQFQFHAGPHVDLNSKGGEALGHIHFAGHEAERPPFLPQQLRDRALGFMPNKVADETQRLGLPVLRYGGKRPFDLDLTGLLYGKHTAQQETRNDRREIT